MTLLNHPLLTEREQVAPRNNAGRPSVLVFGQFKPDRDIDLMAQLSESMGSGVDFRVSGRGWPDIAGWDMDRRFVPELEIDPLIRSASAVLIPYRRFFQSGVAIRCLEQGTPVVGPAESSLAEVLLDDRLLGKDEDVSSWVCAIRAAIDTNREDWAKVRRRYLEGTDAQWTEWVDGFKKR
ncbi:glycosyltransferase [Aeromicrobium yanjiei]|uniref:Glycosyltransferase n=1 Tax=Aeromicrobium yanjiei TaxID=2662028 RepID=A0A5Q2MAA1_9ACTN|nr:glycosyltransferase [Aeromicrobium yanjiei]QGG40034.1 hypothetical protein GEV26_00805 [Aeromicrobium yanjiei]